MMRWLRRLLRRPSFEDQMLDFVDSVRARGHKVTVRKFKNRDDALAWISRDRSHEA